MSKEIYEGMNATAQSEMSWELVKLPDCSYWNSIAYGNGKFVIVPYSGDTTKILYSTDVINWKLVDLPEQPLRYNWGEVVFGKNIFLSSAIATRSNKTLRSTDGVSWTISENLPENVFWNSPVLGNGKFLIVATPGKYTEYTKPIVAQSTDGVSWAIVSTNLPADAPGSYHYINNMFIGSSYSKLFYSSDGLSWVKVQLPVPNAYQICYGNGKYIMCTSMGLYSSTNLTSWTRINTDPIYTETNFYRIIFVDGKYLALTDTANNSEGVYYSTDGISWTLSALPTITHWRELYYLNGKFLVLGGDGNSGYRLAYSE